MPRTQHKHFPGLPFWLKPMQSQLARACACSRCNVPEHLTDEQADLGEKTKLSEQYFAFASYVLTFHTTNKSTFCIHTLVTGGSQSGVASGSQEW